MIEQDTIRLLRECDAGIKMGTSAIDDVMEHVKDEELRNCLTANRRKHDELKADIEAHLDRFHDDGKDPNPIAKSMSWMKTNVKLGLEDSDKVVADLITDGCHMGVKSLGKYLNQYKAADEKSKDIAKRLISLEDKLAIDMRPYL
ncbi:MAG: hypothetical protein IJ448_06325 [Oscillospiraceae bacterium]|nr:hypothetical protein [Oscillospiraceae bacterium]